MPKITIAPIGVTDEQWKKGFTRPFRLSYKDEAGRTIFITDGRIKRVNTLQPGERVMTLTFDSQKRSHTLNFSSSSIDLEVLTAILKCPYIDHPDNKSAMPKIYYIVDHDKRVEEMTFDLKQKISCVNRINNYSHREKSDVAFFVGENPVGKSDNELLLLLVDFHNGSMFTKTQANGMLNMNYFLEKYVIGDKDSVMTTVIKKAIFFNIIEKKDIHYYIGSQLVGANVEDILLYLKNNVQMYANYVEKQVQNKDVLPNDVYTSEKEDTPESTDAEFVGLMKRAAEIKVSGYALMKLKDKAKLRRMVQKKEKELGLISKTKTDLEREERIMAMDIEDETDEKDIADLIEIKELYADKK